jgi:hypothetical protein
MKIAIVNFYESGGGAAKAAKNLHTALLENSINSRLFVVEKSSKIGTIIGFKNKIYSRMLPKLDSLPLKLTTSYATSPFSINWVPFSKIINQVIKFNPDIVHLHWIGFGMMRLSELLKIKKPIVWTLHDNWAFTGGCHIMYDCKLYQTHCGKCPNLNSKKLKDISLKLKSPEGLLELEKEPSFVRQNIKLNDANYSTESNVSRYTLSEGDDKKMEIKPNNPFLHDNVD